MDLSSDPVSAAWGSALLIVLTPLQPRWRRGDGSDAGARRERLRRPGSATRGERDDAVIGRRRPEVEAGGLI
jgi:hypothetical protein